MSDLSGLAYQDWETEKEMTRQAEYYRRNKEKILAERKKQYRAEHPQSHPWKSAQRVIVVPARTDVDRMLDELEKQRRMNKW